MLDNLTSEQEAVVAKIKALIDAETEKTGKIPKTVCVSKADYELYETTCTPTLRFRDINDSSPRYLDFGTNTRIVWEEEK